MAGLVLHNSTSLPLEFPTATSITKLTSALQSCNSLQQAKQIHAFLLRNNLTDHHNCSKLLLLYSSFPSSLAAADYAVLFFQHLQLVPNTFMWNTMIRYHASKNAPLQAISMYKQMREQAAAQPNNYTFNFLTRACTSNLESSLEVLGPCVHAQIIVSGIPETDLHVYTSLINMYATVDDGGGGGGIGAARKLFDRMRHKNAATWNAMITGYVRKGDVEAARRLFDEMPERDEQSWNVMVCGYTRIGKFDVAEELFSAMPVRTLPTWNAMIAGYVRASRPVEAIGLFQEMQLAGVKPDKITLVTVLPACAQLGALELGEWIRVYAERNKFDSNITVCNAIIDMYAKCGCIDKAMDVFKGMKEWSLVSWNTMIAGLAVHGRGEESINLFSQMVTRGVAPDEITFVALLNACSHCGLTEKAWMYFENMKEVYKIEPKIEHYGCMVDVLGRSKRLDEAMEFIASMPMEPNSVILGSLLSACRICKNTQLGEKVLEKLVELEPLNPGYYVLLSNIYASSGKWEEVIQIRSLMKSRGIGKIPGSSLIELDNAVHEFVVGDKTHPQTQEIYKKLNEIHQKLESAGYVPDTSLVLFDLDENEKAQNLSVHSEKLAIAFGLLKEGSSAPIRVVKNLRVCQDCHSAIKLISLLYNRQIILRDCNRFHHFKNGCCSCNDFW